MQFIFSRFEPARFVQKNIFGILMLPDQSPRSLLAET